MKTIAPRALIRPALLIMSSLAVGCSLDNASAPALTGPSEFALSVTLSASPDRVPRDGTSQSVVTITVRDASGNPVNGQRLSVFSDIGSVTPFDVTTGTNGQVTVAYTAPSSGTLGNAATISAVPVGDNAANAVPRTVNILFVGVSNRTAPVPDFVVTPATLEVNRSAVFDASRTQDEGVACMDACLYVWEFGDGTIGTGRIVNHTYTVAKNYTVRLTVTDAAGTSTSIVRDLSVASVAAPTVILVVTPDPPFVSRQAVFTATATAAPGHSVQRYDWNFGDGTTESTTTPSVVKTFSETGTFVVTVSAVDDLGQVGIAAKTVMVGFAVAAPVANFTVSPSSPTAGANVTFNGSSSTVGVGATIVSYLWDLGDGSAAQDTGTTSTLVDSYAAAGTYVVTLTITDSLGRQATKTATVTVQ